MMNFSLVEKDFEVEVDNTDGFHVFTVDFEVEGDYYDLDFTEEAEYFYELNWKTIKFVDLNIRDIETPDYKVTETDIAYVKNKIIDFVLEHHQYYYVDECEVAECK